MRINAERAEPCLHIVEVEDAGDDHTEGCEHEAFCEEHPHDASLRGSKGSHDARLFRASFGLHPEGADDTQAEVDEEEDGTCDFYFLRQPLKNPNASMVCKLSTLWRPELVVLQENLGLPKYANLGKARLITRIADMRSEEEFQSEVCNALLERDYTTIGDIFRKRRTGVRVSIRRKRKTSKKI